MAEVNVFSQSVQTQDAAWLHGREQSRAWFTGSLNAEDQLDLSAEFDAQVSAAVGVEVAKALASLDAEGSAAGHVGLRLQAGLPLDIFFGAGMFARARLEASINGQVAVMTTVYLTELERAVLADLPEPVVPYARILLEEASINAGVWARGSFAAMAVGEVAAIFALFPTDGSAPGVTTHLRYGYAWGFGGGWGTTINIGLQPHRIVDRLTGQAAADLLKTVRDYRSTHPVDTDTPEGWALSAADTLLPEALRVLTGIAHGSTTKPTDPHALKRLLGAFTAPLPGLLGQWLAPRLVRVCTSELFKEGLHGLDPAQYRSLWSAIDMSLSARSSSAATHPFSVIDALADAAGAITAAASALGPGVQADTARSIRCLSGILVLTGTSPPPPPERLGVLFPGADVHNTPPQTLAAQALSHDLAGLLHDHQVLPKWMDELLGGADEVAEILVEQASRDTTALAQRLVELLVTQLLATPAWQEVSAALPEGVRTALNAGTYVLKDFATADLTTGTDKATRQLREGLSVCLVSAVGLPMKSIIDCLANSGLRSVPDAFRHLAEQAEAGTTPPLAGWTWQQLANAAFGLAVGLPSAVLLRKTAGSVEMWCQTALPEELSYLRRSLSLENVCERIPLVGTDKALGEYRSTLLPELGKHALLHLVHGIEFSVKDSTDLFAVVAKSSVDLIVGSLALSTAVAFKAFEDGVAAAERAGHDLQKHADELEGALAGQLSAILGELRKVAREVRGSVDQLEQRLVNWIIDTALGQAQATGLARDVLHGLVLEALRASSGNIAEAIRQISDDLADALTVGSEAFLAAAESAAGLSSGLRGVMTANWAAADMPQVVLPLILRVPNPVLPHILPDIKIEIFRVTLPAELVGRVALTILLDALGIGPLLTTLDSTVQSLHGTRTALAQIHQLIAGQQSVTEQRQALDRSRATGPLSVDVVSPQPSSATETSGTIEFLIRGANIGFARPRDIGLPATIPPRVRVRINGTDVTGRVAWSELGADLRGRIGYTTAKSSSTGSDGQEILVTAPVSVVVAVSDGQGKNQATRAWSFVPRSLPNELVVTCITRDGPDPDASIDEIGGAQGATPWRFALADALSAHDRGTRYYLRGPGGSLVPVHPVAASRHHSRHLQALPRRGATLSGLPNCEDAGPNDLAAPVSPEDNDMLRPDETDSDGDRMDSLVSDDTNDTTEDPPVMAEPKKVLILRNSRDLSVARTHALDCRWVRGVKLDYVEADASMFPPNHPRCSYCGGGR